ncbi:hypothetical protein [Actinacidiphila oryziradicis]|uniref:hypothetical protein n=1 Tax=Actinacidiphila oryziradicis TaxID=2571141 RepID=UPI001FEB751A|nr:hypothetical protein [Actinacidiphila oryziradicis]
MCYRGLRTLAFDGCRSTRVPESEDNVSWLGRHKIAADTVTAYPLLSVLALVETGTRALARRGGRTVRGEVGAALELLGHLGQDMLVLADRGFDADEFVRSVHSTDAALLLRVSSSREPAVLQVLEDGSYLSVIAGVPVRGRPGHPAPRGVSPETGGVPAAAHKAARPFVVRQSPPLAPYRHVAYSRMRSQ